MLVEDWRIEDNTLRPHSALFLAGLTCDPAELPERLGLG